MDGTEKRPPGRPRSAASHQAILAAAERLLIEDGYSNVTIDGIAARAGVGKQTIYRWWPTKADLILEVCASKSEFSVPVDDHGSYVDDLRAFLIGAFTMASRAPTADLLRGLMVEAQLRADFGDRFRATFLEPRRQTFVAMTQRAAARGDLPSSPSPETTTDIVFGTLWYRLLTARHDLNHQLIEDLVQTLT
jgi:AcrR family transcriptional regulator